MKTEIATITPEIAKHLLLANTKNRHMRPDHVAALARDMAAGKFQLNGDAIRLCADGVLLDGQHRLSACVAAGVSFQTVLVTGLNPTTRATIDTGAKRTYGDRLSMDGVQSAALVAASLRVLAMCLPHGRRAFGRD